MIYRGPGVCGPKDLALGRQKLERRGRYLTIRKQSYCIRIKEKKSLRRSSSFGWLLQPLQVPQCLCKPPQPIRELTSFHIISSVSTLCQGYRLTGYRRRHKLQRQWRLYRPHATGYRLLRTGSQKKSYRAGLDQWPIFEFAVDHRLSNPFQGLVLSVRRFPVAHRKKEVPSMETQYLHRHRRSAPVEGHSDE
jgi:hypothetical protein